MRQSFLCKLFTQENIQVEFISKEAKDISFNLLSKNGFTVHEIFSKYKVNNINEVPADDAYETIEIIKDKYVIEGLNELKRAGIVEKVGTSIYIKDEIDASIKSGVYDFIQAPLNIINRGLYDYYKLNYEKDIEFVARSIILQGRLLNRGKINNNNYNTNSYTRVYKIIDEICENFKITVLELIICSIFNLKGVNHIIVGSTSILNIQNIINCLNKRFDPEIYGIINKLNKFDQKIIDPRLW